MDEEMEDCTIFTFTAVEIDLDYEFDAARYFDFIREESFAEARQAETWFESAGSYPPSPFVKKLLLREDTLLENVTTSPKTEKLENMALLEIDSDIGMDPENSAMDMRDREFEGRNSTDLRNSIVPNFHQTHCIPTGLTFYNHMIESKAKRNTAVKPSVPRTSTLMKATASQLAKQNCSNQTGDSSVRNLKFVNKEKGLNNTIASENQAAKRQKLEGGQLRKVADTNQQTHLVHKEPKRDGNISGNSSTHAKLRITIPRQPDLKTAQRAERMRPKVSREREQVTSTTPAFRALPLNRKILEGPSLLLPKRSTPRLPDFQEFHLKTSEISILSSVILSSVILQFQAMQHNTTVPSYSVHCNNSKVLHHPRAGSVAECSTKDPIRPNIVDAPNHEGCEIVHKFKALPLNKKIFSSKGDIGVFRNNKREATVPMEFNLHTERRVRHDPPIELFNKLNLTSELRPSSGSQLKLPRPTCTFAKGSKENRLGSFQQESEVKTMVQEKPPLFKVKQIPSLGGNAKFGALSSISRSSGMR